MKDINFFLSYTIKLFSFILTFSSTLRADDTSGYVVNLSPYIVSGETYAFGAQKVLNVDAEDMEKQIAFDYSDIFGQDPSIKVGGGFGPAQKLYVRGIEDKLLNIYIDGASQAGYLSHHHGQFSIEPELLKYVEAEPGAGSAVTGPGALAGTIRFETKSASDFFKVDQSTGLFIKSAYCDNADEWKLTAVGYGAIGENVEFLVAYTYGESGDYEDGNGDFVDYTGSDRGRSFVRLDGTLAERHQLGFSYEETFEKGHFRHRPNFAGYFNHPIASNGPVYMDIGRETLTVDYGFVPQDLNVKTDIKVYSTEFIINRPTQYEMGYTSLGVDVDAESVFGQHQIQYGIDYRDDTAFFTGKGQAVGFAGSLVYKTIPDETINLIGVYLQDAWQAYERVQISLGARFDKYDYTDKDGKNYDDTGFSPNLGVSLELTDNLDFNVSYGSAFRGVTPIDLITANEGGVTNADNIDGESSRNVEVGFQYDSGLFFANGTIYQQKISDVILSKGVRDNGGELEVDGYDFSTGLKYASLTASLGVSDSNPELNGQALIDSENGIGVGSGRTWNANIDYLIEEFDISMGWNLSHVEAYSESAEPLAHKDAYTVNSLYVRWRPLKDQTLALNAAVSNVFDEFYVDQSTSGYNSRLQRVAGLPEPGRSLKFSISYQF